MPAVRDRRPPEVLSTDEARKALPQTSRGFAEQGADAEPVFFGAHRQPAGVMLSYERYLRMLDDLDDLSIALEVRRRDIADTGDRVSLDELIAEQGLSRSDIG
jgi:hypothetical protein